MKMALIGGNKDLATHINQRIKEGWLIIFELNGLDFLRDVETVVYPPETPFNKDFELTGNIGAYGSVSIGFCKKTGLLKDYFNEIGLNPPNFNINNTAFCFVNPPINGKLYLSSIPYHEEVDYTEAMVTTLDQLMSGVIV